MVGSTSLLQVLLYSNSPLRTIAHACTGLIVLERNYLDVFPYDKWSSKELPELREGQEFTPHACEVRQGETSPPTLLTEADLVAEMDKNGIGMTMLL